MRTNKIYRDRIDVVRRWPVAQNGNEHGILTVMAKARKIRVERPPELLERAQRATRTGVTQTVRMGLQLVAASRAYEKLRSFRGRVRFSRDFTELKVDR